jgi:anti-sigma-K factor RskA
MSENDTMNSADDGNLIAAEYVLGVLSAAERREFEGRLSHEPALASEVAFWEERLSGLADTVAPVSPPEAAWSRIESAIGTAPERSSVWQSVSFWRRFAIASATLAAASIAALAYVGLMPGARSPLTATLSGSPGQPGQPNFVAAVTASGDSLLIVPAALVTNDRRAFELWLIPTGETQPRPVGLIQPGQPTRLEISSNLVGRLTRDATLAVSLEPPGGSPTGLPTGPVIASGKLTNL